MKQNKKTFLGGFIAILIGTSCCWFSTAAIWLGSVGVFNFMTGWLSGFQFMLLLLVINVTIFLLFRMVKRKKRE